MVATPFPLVVVLLSSIILCSLSSKSCPVRIGEFCWGALLDAEFCCAALFLSLINRRSGVAGVLFVLVAFFVVLLLFFVFCLYSLSV